MDHDSLYRVVHEETAMLLRIFAFAFFISAMGLYTPRLLATQEVSQAISQLDTDKVDVRAFAILSGEKIHI